MDALVCRYRVRRQLYIHGKNFHIEGRFAYERFTRNYNYCDFADIKIPNAFHASEVASLRSENNAIPTRIQIDERVHNVL